MEITRSEQQKSRKVALGVTMISFTVLILFMIFKQIHTSAPDHLGITPDELMVSLLNSGNNIISVEKEISAPVNSNGGNSENQLARNDAEIYKIKSDVQRLADQFRSFKEKKLVESQVTSPDITEHKGNLIGIKEGNNATDLQYGIDVPGRKVILAPGLIKDASEEGTVVVEILVDNNGNVNEASPNGRGTNTSSSSLKAKAKKMALATKFNSVPGDAYQKGTITINFMFD